MICIGVVDIVLCVDVFDGVLFIGFVGVFGDMNCMNILLFFIMFIL